MVEIQRIGYFENVKPFINTELIKVFIGLRRVGKSILMQQIRSEIEKSNVNKKNIISYNFEQIENAKLCSDKKLHKNIISKTRKLKGKVYLFFDEIQEVSNWEKCINSLRLDIDCDIYITGSNAKLLSGELATYLAGRYVHFTVYPFSFAEFIKANECYSQNDTKSQSEIFQQYIKSGGMPFVSSILNMPNSSEQYLYDVFNSVVLKDIISRNKVRNIDLLERIINYTFKNIAHTFSASSLAKYFKSEFRSVSHETIMNYLNFCTQAMLFYKVPRKEISTKKVLSVNEKYYIADHSIATAVYGKSAASIDQILENIVCIESLRRGYEVFTGKNGEKEIDFVLEKNGKTIYIQVAYLLASPETIDREFGAFKNIRDNFPKYVVSLDDFDRSENGIIHRNIKEFLLGEW